MSGAVDVINQLLIYQISKMISIAIFSPVFVLPIVMLAIAGGLVGNIFMKARMSAQRELSNIKAPLLSHFGAALGGISEWGVVGVGWWGRGRGRLLHIRWWHSW